MAAAMLEVDTTHSVISFRHSTQTFYATLQPSRRDAPEKKPAYLFKIHAFNTRKKCTNTCTMQAHTRTRFVSNVLCTLHIYIQTHPHTHRVASDCRLLFALESMLLVLCCMSILPLLPYESSSKPRDERMDMLRRDRIGKKNIIKKYTPENRRGREGAKGKIHCRN